jgi:hypothetical protein
MEIITLACVIFGFDTLIPAPAIPTAQSVSRRGQCSTACMYLLHSCPWLRTAPYLDRSTHHCPPPLLPMVAPGARVNQAGTRVIHAAHITQVEHTAAVHFQGIAPEGIGNAQRNCPIQSGKLPCGSRAILQK